MQYCVCGKFNEVGTIVVWNNLSIGRKHSFIEFIYFFFECFQHFGRVFTFPHHDNCFNSIGFIGNDSFTGRISGGTAASNPSQTGNIGDFDLGNVFYQNWNAIVVGNNNVFYFIDVIQ